MSSSEEYILAYLFEGGVFFFLSVMEVEEVIEPEVEWFHVYLNRILLYEYIVFCEKSRNS